METLFCPTFVARGGCDDPQCSFNHTNCILCQKSGLSRWALWDHFQTADHKKNLNRYMDTMWRCPVCNVSLKLKNRSRHEGRKFHRKKLAKLSAQKLPSTAQQSITSGPAQQQSPLSTNPTYRCNICQKRVSLPQWEEHLLDPSHARKVRLVSYSQALKEGSRDKFGITIMPAELDFGIIDLSTLFSWPTRENVFYIQLEEGEARLANIRLSSPQGSLAAFRDVK